MNPVYFDGVSIVLLDRPIGDSDCRVVIAGCGQHDGRTFSIVSESGESVELDDATLNAVETPLTGFWKKKYPGYDWYIVAKQQSGVEGSGVSQSMKRTKRGCLFGLIAAAVISLVLYIPIWINDAEARQNRARVNELIFVGQSLTDAQQILRDSGFKLSYDEPIKPTIDEDYLHQLVIVGETQPNPFESFAYAAGLFWMPFTHSESPYVIINADLDGNITEID